MNLYVSIGSPFIGLYWLGFAVALVWIGFELIAAFVTERQGQMPPIFRNLITFRDTNYGRDQEHNGRYYDSCADITVWSWIGTLVVGSIIGFFMIFLWPFFTGWALLHVLRWFHHNKELVQQWFDDRQDKRAAAKEDAADHKKMKQTRKEQFKLRGTEE